MSLLGKTLLSFIQIFSKFHTKSKVDALPFRGKLYFQAAMFYAPFYDIACKGGLNYVNRYPNAGNLYDERDCLVFVVYKYNSGNPI